MAFASTSLSKAVTITDKQIVVASATSMAAGRLILIDGELMQAAKDYVSGTTVNVLRGLGGTATTTHPITSEVVHGLATDYGSLAPSTGTNFPYRPAVVKTSYSADGEIALPTQGSNGLVVLNAVSTTVLTMTLPVPTADMDGVRMTFLSRNGTGAHVLYIGAVAAATSGTGLNGAGSAYDKFTFPAGPVMLELMAYNEAWFIAAAPAITGTVTLLTGGIA